MKQLDRTERILIGVSVLAFAYAVLGNYVALPGYLRFLDRGGTSAAGNDLDLAVVIGAVRTIVWMLAFNIGALCLYYAALRSGPRTLRRLGVLIGTIWLLLWIVPELPRAHVLFYLVFGSTILVMITLAGIGLLRDGAGTSGVEDDRSRFFLKTSLFFFAVATWDVCGLGSTGRILDPALVVLERSQTLLATQTTKLMLAFVCAWSAMMLALRPPSPAPTVVDGG